MQILGHLDGSVIKHLPSAQIMPQGPGIKPHIGLPALVGSLICPLPFPLPAFAPPRAVSPMWGLGPRTLGTWPEPKAGTSLTELPLQLPPWFVFKFLPWTSIKYSNKMWCFLCIFLFIYLFIFFNIFFRFFIFYKPHTKIDSKWMKDPIYFTSAWITWLFTMGGSAKVTKTYILPLCSKSSVFYSRNVLLLQMKRIWNKVIHSWFWIADRKYYHVSFNPAVGKLGFYCTVKLQDWKNNYY